MISPQQLNKVFPYCRDPGNWCRTFAQVAEEFELNTTNRLTMWLAQCGYESSSFNILRELMSYRTPGQIRLVYPSKFQTEAAAMPYVLNPQGLANFVYANREGNGDPASGDGFRYRGGGLIQLTFKNNYKRVGDALSLDLAARPNQIEQPAIAARTAGFFWTQNDLNAAADDGNFDYTTRRINGDAMEGAQARRALWHKLVAVVGA